MRFQPRRDRLGRFTSGSGIHPPTAAQRRNIPKKPVNPDPTVIYGTLAAQVAGHRIAEQVLKGNRTLDTLVHRISDAGGRVMLVGGAVRDRLLDQPSADLDVEVLGINQDTLERVLATVGPVDLVGRAFAVYKIGDLDIALPRTERKTGLGHTAFTVTPDPTLTPAAAAQRRDFTINAISVDLATGELIDPTNGVHDLHHRVLRHVGPAFAEDPLRVLRGAQFCARFGLKPDPKTLMLAQSLRGEMHTLADERIAGEWHKLITKGHHPSLGLVFLRDAGWLPGELPDAVIPDAALSADRARKAPLSTPQRTTATWAAMTATLPDHDAVHLVRRLAMSKPAARDALITRTLAIELSATASDRHLRHAADQGQPLETVIYTWAAMHDTDPEPLLARVRSLGILHTAEPHLIGGEDLIAAGHTPGPAFGHALAAARAAQLDGTITTPEQALTVASSHLR